MRELKLISKIDGGQFFLAKHYAGMVRDQDKMLEQLVENFRVRFMSDEEI